VFETFIGTTDGICRLGDDGLQALGLEGERVSAVHAWRSAGGETTVLAGTYGARLYRSTDGAATWARVDAGLTASAFRCLGPDPHNPAAILAGTEPARIFRSADGGQTWSELEGVAALPGHERWFLPYSPRAGAVRNVYGPPGRDDLLASVEVGGLLRSPDGGRTWSCQRVIADEDIHHVTGHPEDRDRLYVSLGTASVTDHGSDGPPLGGIARSRDGGATWEKVEADYTRATLVPPSRPDLIVAGPALRVGRGGRIVVSADGGDTWDPAGDGVEIPMPDMVELFAADPEEGIWAICSRGRLLRAEAGRWAWRSALPPGAAVDVEAIAFVPRTA
jgi:photosystem II stability/assembly factor-like uncharacterized protein